MPEIDYPYVQQSQHSGFYLMAKDENPWLLKSVSLVAALREAQGISPDLNKKQYVDRNGSIQSILFGF